MAEMVERVAKAMRDSLGVDWPYTGHEFLMDVAHAAITAMRNPTQAMLDAGPVKPYMDADVWASMIDAALE